MSKLFSSLQLRNLKIRNRVVMSPMCQYSAIDGLAQAWHLVHYGSRATGGVGLVILEATSVSPEGRISNEDLGLWNQEQEKALSPIIQFMKLEGAAVGLQIAHAGRKGVNGNLFDPNKMTIPEMQKIKKQFCQTTERCLELGFDLVEIHAAHGYLLHTFLSPLSNQRTDQYGGSLENRMRFPLEVIAESRKIWPSEKPLFVRISATDWVEGGWDIPQSVEFSKKLKSLGIDLIDCSSGGIVANAKIPVGPGYQVSFAQDIRKQTQIMTGAVGMITTADQAEQILQEEKADLVFLARELLRNPNWSLYAAAELKDDIRWPQQYLRARI